jgi:hypothetical protein
MGRLILGSRSRVCSFVIMKKNTKERIVNMQFLPNGIFDKAELPESVHEKVDPRACRPYHLCQSFLT